MNKMYLVLNQTYNLIYFQKQDFPSVSIIKDCCFTDIVYPEYVVNITKYLVQQIFGTADLPLCASGDVVEGIPMTLFLHYSTFVDEITLKNLCQKASEKSLVLQACKTTIASTFFSDVIFFELNASFY